jgi:translation initiation factor 2B subunit (eIF-2B alpha/beta/delta family)
VFLCHFLLADIVECYKALVAEVSDISVPVAAIKALTRYIQHNRANTMIEFTRDLEAATKTLMAASQNCVSVTAGCELFTRFVTRAGADTNEVLVQDNCAPSLSCTCPLLAFRTLKPLDRA